MVEVVVLISASETVIVAVDCSFMFWAFSIIGLGGVVCPDRHSSLAWSGL
jgi:hypothetical protein